MSFKFQFNQAPEGGRGAVPEPGAADPAPGGGQARTSQPPPRLQ